MSLLSGLFGKSHSAFERDLLEAYSQTLSSITGFSPSEARKTVSQAISMCKKQGKAEGTADLPENFGDLLFDGFQKREPMAVQIIEKVRREGCSDDDIAEWWNLPDLSRRMILWSEDMFRYRVFVHALHEKGMNPDDAGAHVQKIFPIYGDPDDTTKLSGEKRPLPHELRGRVDAYRRSRGAQYIVDQVKNFPSYNAFVRHAIREGEL